MTYLCLATTEPGPRNTSCPSELHDWPLPSGYVDAAEEAQWRLASNRRPPWSQRRCPSCGLFGWIPGELREGQTASRYA